VEIVPKYGYVLAIAGKPVQQKRAAPNVTVLSAPKVSIPCADGEPVLNVNVPPFTIPKVDSLPHLSSLNPAAEPFNHAS